MVNLTPALCRAARGLLSWSQRELARRSGVSKRTIAAFELEDSVPHARTARDLIEALEASGVLFIEPLEGVHDGGVALRRRDEPADGGKEGE